MAPLISIYRRTQERIEEILQGRSFLPSLTMRCCMLGARGVGKTSVITSLYNSQREAVSGTALFLTPDGRTQQILQGKKTMLEQIFKGLHEKGELVTESGLPGDATESVFCFTYGMRSERVNIGLEIRDYPGEYLRKEPERVAEFIRESDAVIIAIDTPCMMEADGKYHRGKNRPELVTSFLTHYLDGAKEMLVMFVPLKCEKYYHEGRIDEVTAKIEEDYSELIAGLKGKRSNASGKKSICCVIAPIQTLGGIEFDSFETDETGAVEEFVKEDGGILPEHVNYHYCKTNAKYEPKYCEQPLFFLLSFVSKQYAKAKSEGSQSGLLGKLGKLLRLIPQIDEFLLEMEKLGRHRLLDTQGYKVLFGRGKV